MSYGLLTPTSRVSRPFGSPIEVYRCQTDGGLIGNGQLSNPSFCKKHGGHTFRQPALIKLHELVMIWLRLIK